MKFGPLLDWRSLFLCVLTYLFKFASPTLAVIDYKIILEIIGSIAGVSTITYNVVKTYGEIVKFVSSYKWKRLRKKDKPYIEPTDATIEKDQFD